MEPKRKYRKRNTSGGDVIRMLSIERIRELYGFHPNTVRSWVNSDRLRHIRRGPGGKIYIRQEDVERHIQLWYE